MKNCQNLFCSFFISKIFSVFFFHFYFLVFGLFFFLLPSRSRATHLMGGNISYEYLGETFPGSNQYNYKVTLITFLDCTSPFWGSGFPESSLTLGIYEGTSTPGATMPFITNLTLPLVDSVPVVPPLPNGCTIPDIPCVYQITYVETVALPLSFSGYHLYYERCCRNGTIQNLANPGGEGMVFSAYIPPTIAVNNSPVFTDMPVPFICVNDTTGILNTAFDPDGDLLIFSFENPYEGAYTDGTTPAIGTYPDPINWPFPPITWQSGGFNKNSPFGPSGYAFINSFTGYSLYKPPATGNYVVAVEIKEYRNGNLIGITRRDMQLLVITCNPNPPPVLSTSGGSGTLTHIIEEGQSLCFPITFTDLNTISLATTGKIFDPSFTNPPATITTPVTGTGTVTTQFCWNTGCNQGQALPYLFYPEATDNGCPPKSTPIVYSITVNNFSGPTSITGINNICPGISGLGYSTSIVAGATYNWVVTGGTISSGQGTNAIVVNWGNGPSGNVAVTTTSQFGCPSGPINLPITFNTAISVLAGPNKSVCSGDTVTIGGSPTAPSGTVLVWSPSTGLSNTGIQNPVASPSTTTTYIATATNSSGCIGKDTVIVTVNPSPVANAGNDSTICLSGSVQLSASGGNTYNWFPSTGLNNPNIQNPIATPTDTITYSVVATNSNNCKDTDSVTIFIITDTPADAGADKTICAGDSVLIGGNFQVPFGANLTWTPNISLSNNSILHPNASPASTTTYKLTVTTGSGCSGVDSVQVIVNPVPLAKAGNDTLICDGDTIQLLATGGGTYQWVPSTGLSNSSISNPLANPLTSTQYILTVSANNCSKKDTLFIFVFSSTVTVTSDTGICSGDTVQLLATGTGNASFAWFPGGTLNDDSIASPLAFPTGNVEYFVHATDTNNCSSLDSVTISVNPLPVVDAGTDKEICTGDTAQLNASGGIIFVWNPPATLNDDSINNPKAFPLDTTTYFVVATDSKNCSNKDSVKIIVNPLPVIQASSDTSICNKGTAQLNVTGASTYSWSPPSTLNNPIIPNPIATPITTTKYIVTANDSNNCKGKDSVTVSIFPKVVAASNDTGMCLSDTVQLNVSGGTVFSWTPSSTVNNSTIANPIAFPLDTTTYIVHVVDINSCQDSDSVTVIVYPLPVITASNDTAICSGNCVSLFAAGADIFSWSPITNLDNPNIANPISCSNDTIMYYVTGSGSGNLIINGNFDLGNLGFTSDYTFFPPPPSVPPIIMNGQYSVVPDVDLVHNSWNGNDHTSGTGNFLVADGSTIAGLDIWCQTVQVNPNTNYTFSYWVSTLHTNNLLSKAIIQTSINGIVTGSTLTAPANSGIWVQFQTTWNSGNNSSASICLMDLMTGGGVGNDFALDDISLINQASSFCSNTDSVKIIVNPLPVAQAGNDTTICEGGIVQMNATGGTVFLWNPPTFLNNQNISNPTSSPVDTVIYSLTVKDGNNCADTDSVTINVNKLPLADAGPDTWLCPGDSVQLNATGGNFFSWTPAPTLSNPGISSPLAGPSDTVKYFVTVTNLNLCSKQDSVTVFVNGIVPTNAGPDVFICLNDSVQIGGSPTSPVGTIYSWNPVASIKTPTVSNPFAIPGDTLWYFVFTTNDTCKGADSVLVIVNPLPIVNAGADKEICKGDTIQLNATGGNSFVWSNPATLNDDSIPNPLAFPSDTTKYFVIATDGNTCSNMDSVQIDVNDLPIIDAGTDKSICPGDSVQLNATGGFVFVWTPPATLSDDSISNPFSKPASSTLYLVNSVDTNGCKGLDSVLVAIFPKVISITPDTGICFGDTVQLEIKGGKVFIWNPVATLNDGTIANPLAFPADTTKYFVAVIDTNNCSYSDSVMVNILALPVLTVCSDTGICIGTCVELFASGASSFFWTPGTGLNNQSIPNPVSCTTDTTVYFVTGTNKSNLILNGDFENGNSGFSSGYDYFPPPPSIPPIIMNGEYSVVPDVNLVHNNWIGNDHTSGAGNFLVADGSTTAGLDIWCQTINVQSNTNYPFSFWVSTLHTNNLLSAAIIQVTINGVVIGNPITAPADAGIWVQFQNTWNSGPATTASICLQDLMTGGGVGNDFAIDDINLTNPNIAKCSNTDSVKIIINPQPVAQANNDTTICRGEIAQLNASGGLSYLWFPSNSLSDPNIFNPLSDPPDTIEYFAKVMDGNNCSDTDSVTVNVNQLPIVNAGTDKIICLSDTTQLSATGGILFVWDNSSLLSDDSIFNPLAFPTDTTRFIVSVDDNNNCKNTDTVMVIVNPLPDADAGSNDEICLGDTFHLFASGGVDYAWTFSQTLSNLNIQDPFAFPADTTKYFVKVTDSNGCSKTDSVKIDVNKLPLVLAGNDTNSCKNSGVVLGGSPTGPPGAVYLWSPTFFLDNKTLPNPTSSPDSTITYFVNVTDTNGCKNIDSITVSIFSIKSIADTSFCKGDSISLFVTPVSGTNPITYVWSPAMGLNSTGDSLVHASPGTDIIYQINVTDGKGCAETKSIEVIANLPPKADFDFKLYPACEGLLAEFKNKSQGASSYEWVFGEGGKSEKENLQHVFPYNQIMNVTLTAFNDFCKDDTSVTSSIKSFTDYFDLSMPNVLTPNNDGMNDCFEIDEEKKYGDCSELHVFNRWGELMYVSGGNQHSWCGRTFAGEDVPTGTYFYVFDVNGFLFKGTVMVIR